MQTLRKLGLNLIFSALSNAFFNFADLKSVFNATDRVGEYHVFNIGGNKYRIITSIHFNGQRLYILKVLTHKEYDSWKP